MSLPNRKVLEDQYEADRRLYELILQELSQRFRDWLEPLDIHPGFKVRVKSFKSWFDKVLRKIRHGVSPTEVQIHDVLGMRIVCPFMEDIKKIEELIREKFTVLEEERKGALQSFKEFGYESTHFLIALPHDLVASLSLNPPPPCEIQIRTILQDAWAEVEHELVYKSQFFPFDQPLKRKMAALNANLTLSDIIFQEIREYQRQLNRELEKRRHHFFDHLQTPESEEEAAEAEGPVRMLDDPPPPVENMDQALLDALTAHNLKNHKKAINLYSAILRLGPIPFIQSLVLVHRGMAYFSEGLYENALEDFDKAIERDPFNAKAFYYRGTVRDSMGEAEAALADLTRSLELVPYQFEALLARSKVLLGLFRHEEALEDCTSALNLTPEDPQALDMQKKILVEKSTVR